MNLKKDEVTQIEEAVVVLKQNGVIIYPTDTVYGIGVLPNKESINRLYKIKKRDKSKRLIALISNPEIIYKIVDLTNELQVNVYKFKKIIAKYWHGDLTIVVKAREEILEIIEKSLGKIEDGTIGVRIPNDPIALKIIEKAGGVVLTTSANFSGEEPVKEYEDLNKDLANQVDYVVHASRNGKGVPSTIIKILNGEITVIRKGNIGLDEIIEGIGSE